VEINVEVNVEMWKFEYGNMEINMEIKCGNMEVECGSKNYLKF